MKSDALDQSEGISPWQSQCSHLNSFNTSMLQCRKVTLVNKVSVQANSTRFCWMQTYDCKRNHLAKKAKSNYNKPEGLAFIVMVSSQNCVTVSVLLKIERKWNSNLNHICCVLIIRWWLWLKGTTITHQPSPKARHQPPRFMAASIRSRKGHCSHFSGVWSRLSQTWTERRTRHYP